MLEASNKRFYSAVVLLVAVAAASHAKTGDLVSSPDPRLSEHPSPYLREHANDPIHWQLLSENTLSAANKYNRPILISSGYLSCYWCYRMKVDTFSHKKLSRMINQHFVPILIDRELNPEDDEKLQLFMRETQRISGWPMTLILTPEGYPVYGYSYVDAETMMGVLSRFLEIWEKSPTHVSEQARSEWEKIVKGSSEPEEILQKAVLGDLFLALLDQTSAAADTEFGGFGEPEKYLFVPQLLALIDFIEINPAPRIAAFVTLTIERILDGAMVDPIEGGVFRYSDGRAWDSPHFEQMLYTQALFSKLLFRGARAFGNEIYAMQGIRIQKNMINQFKDKDGWYVSSLSAISDKEEDGGYYLWTPESMGSLLGDAWEEKVENVLSNGEHVLPRPVGDDAKLTGQVLIRDRKNRRLDKDNKKLAGWNGLVLSALSTGAAFDSGLYDEAEKLANKLLLEWHDHSIPYLVKADISRRANLETIVYVASGLFDWWQISNQAHVLQSVRQLLKFAYENYYDEGKWRTGESLLPGLEAKTAMPDTQLPSASGEWFRLSGAVVASSQDGRFDWPESVREMSSRWTKSMLEEAFFHATFISALVAQKWLESKANKATGHD